MSEPAALIRFPDLMARGITRNRAQLQNLIKDRGFPAGWLLSPNARVWDACDVDAWLQDRREAARVHSMQAVA